MVGDGKHKSHRVFVGSRSVVNTHPSSVEAFVFGLNFVTSRRDGVKVESPGDVGGRSEFGPARPKTT